MASLRGQEARGSAEPKTAGNSEKQRAISLLFQPLVARNPRISAANAMRAAVNFQEIQQKQRAGLVPGVLSKELPGLCQLRLQRVQQAGFRGRCAIGVAGAERPELCRVARKSSVVERQG